MNSHSEKVPSSEPNSPSTGVTTPEQDEDNDDIWGSDSHDETSAVRPARDELLSDLPTIKRQHMTDGYREGLAVGKAKVMQQGFDAAYPIGVQIALRVGLVLGVLEGYLAAKSVATSPQKKAAVQKIYDAAKEELSCPALLKVVSDEVIADAKAIPGIVEEVIAKWERSVLGPKNDSGA